MSQHPPQLLRQQHSSSLSLPSGNYIYSLARCGTTGDSLAAISSDDSLRIFDRQTLQLRGGGGGDCFANNIHKGGVTSLCDVGDGNGGDEAGGNNDNLLATGGRDGRVRLWDVRGEGKPVVEFQTGGRFISSFFSLFFGCGLFWRHRLLGYISRSQIVVMLSPVLRMDVELTGWMDREKCTRFICYLPCGNEYRCCRYGAYVFAGNGCFLVR